MMEELEKYYRASREANIKRIMSLVGNRSVAEDCVQSAYLKAMLKIDNFNPEIGTFKQWFSRILLNAAYSSKKKVQEVDIDDCILIEDERPSTSGADRLEKKLDGMDETYKVIGKLYYVKGYDSVDIAEIVHLSPDNIRKICSRIAKELRDVR